MSPRPGASALKIGSRALHGLGRPADHETIAALQTPNAAAGADIEVINSARGQFLRAANVVDVIGISAVDDAVVSLKSRCEFLHAALHSRGRNHEPGGARRSQPGDELFHRSRADRALLYQCLHILGVAIVDDAFVIVAEQAQNHVRAHPAESDHSYLHVCILLKTKLPTLAAFAVLWRSASEKFRSKICFPFVTELVQIGER